MTYQDAMRKVMALLRLADAERNPNAEQAAAAAAKAQELIDRYKLDVASADYDSQQEMRDQEDVQAFDDDPLGEAKGTYHMRWSGQLAMTICMMNQCMVYRSMTGTITCVWQIIGRPSDVSAVRYLFSYFQREVNRLADAACVGHSRAYWGQFCCGVVDTIRRKLHASQKQTFAAKRAEVATNSMALVRVDQALAKLDKRTKDVEEFAKKKLKLRDGRAANFKKATGGRERGQLEGEKVRIPGARAALGSGQRQIAE